MAKKFNNLSIGEMDTKVYELFPALREMVTNHNPSKIEELDILLGKIAEIRGDAEKAILTLEGYL